MISKIILILYTVLSGCVDAATYDQRQTGQLNVQVDLKDLEIIAVLKGNKEEYVDYDYAYDYSEMTIKPQNGTTPKPLNGTSTVANIVQVNSTTVSSVEQTTFSTTPYGLQTTDTVPTQQTNDKTTLKDTDSVVVSTPNSVPVVSHKNNDTANANRCKKGFVMNNKGGCELRLQGSGNTLLKLVRLSQKLKQRRENRSPSKPV